MTASPPRVDGPPRRASLGEAAAVLGLPTVVFTASAYVAWPDAPRSETFSDQRLLLTLGAELALVALLVPWLLRRGWRPREVGGSPEPSDVLRGVGVWLGVMAVYFLSFLLFQAMFPDDAKALLTTRPAGTLSASVVVLASIVNPIFEEFLWVGYALPTLGVRLGPRWAMAVSVLLRIIVHFYQGIFNALSIGPIGVLFAAYYVRRRRVWPLVVAHLIMDALALAAFVKSAG